MKKALFCLLLSIVLLISLFTSVAFAANTTIQVQSSNNAPKSGESFTVTVYIDGNPGFNSIQYILGFPDGVSCKSINQGVLLNGMMTADNPNAVAGAAIAGASATIVSGDGVIATYNMTASEDIADLRLTIEDMVLSDESGALIAYTVSGASEQSSSSSQSSGSTQQSSTPAQNPAGNQQGGASSGITNAAIAETTSGAATTQTSESVSFKDTKGHWAAEFIENALQKGLFKGNSDGTFEPDKNISRAQYVTVLYRMAGSPAVTAGTPFKDISDQPPEFRNAIAWAYTNGYVNGTSDTTFEPSKSISRQESMKILFGCAGGKSGNETIYTSIYDSGFADSMEIASWARAAMYWAYYNEIIGGTSATTLSPTENASRAQLAKILVNYLDKGL